MIAIDTSALIAILADESERRHFNEVIAASPIRLVSAVNLLETRMVIFRRFGPSGLAALEAFLSKAELQVRPVTAATVDLAFDGFRRFGKGGGHPAQLNFGDCFAYALALEQGCPLLFKGRDFALTGIESAAGSDR